MRSFNKTPWAGRCSCGTLFVDFGNHAFRDERRNRVCQECRANVAELAAIRVLRESVQGVAA